VTAAVSDFGSRLREARERRGITLRDIAERTKISIATLESIERNDSSRLPGGIFARSFVRSYATEVGLDPDATVREFVARFDAEHTPTALDATPAVDIAGLFRSHPLSAVLLRAIAKIAKIAKN
jgi:cytoskeletal protein RodZ